MATRSYLVVIYGVLTIQLAVAYNSIKKDDTKYCKCDEAFINRRGFPDGFIFGSASAAYQIEGGYDENGKGPTMWDHFTHTYPEKIRDQSNGDIAADSYHLYKEDVRFLKDMGADAYRISISWARILPGGAVSKGVNKDGIDYYNNVINELISNGIQPWVSILHLDTPQALQHAYGGFLSSQIVADFQDFAELLFREFGDRVKYWITTNEPWVLSHLGHGRGVFAPGRCSDWLGNNCTGGDSAIEPYIVTHNQLLAHATVVKLYRNKYQQVQNGKIGIILNSFWFLPYDEKHENLDAKYRALDFMLGWFMDPITFGRYPESMRSRVGARLPEFTKEEAEMVKGSFDFLGLNYYSSNYALNINHPTKPCYPDDSGVIFTGEKNGIPIGEQGSTGSYYYDYPKGLRGILQYIKVKYNNPLIYISENGKKKGFDEDGNDNLPMSEVLKDNRRKEYILDHLCCLREAIEEDGVNVKGYFVWSLLDNFEWASGYLVRFGLHYVDFTDKNRKRHPKDSALWFKSIIAAGKTEKNDESIRISDE